MDTNLFYLVAVLLAFTSCKKSAKTLSVDNPTDRYISFKIDEGLTMGVAPFMARNINISQGPHSVMIDSQTYEIVIEDKDYLLNPSLSSYVVESREYRTKGDNLLDSYYAGLEEPLTEMQMLMRKHKKREVEAFRKRHPSKVTHDTISIYGLELAGNYKQTNGFLIEKIWNYSTRQPFPPSIQSSSSDPFVSKVKIYRQDLFLEKLIDQEKEEDYPAGLDLMRVIKLMDSIKRVDSLY